MAILGSTTLTGCNSIPEFIGTGTIMVFHQTSAPTSWTKQDGTDFNDITLRVIGGANGTAFAPRVDTPFTSVFIADKGLTVPLNSNPAVIGIQPATQILTRPAAQGGTVQLTSINGSAVNAIGQNGATLARLRTHSHVFQRCPTTLTAASGVSQPRRAPRGTALIPLTSGQGPAQGAAGQHNHGVSDGQHSHPISAGTHNHAVTDPGHTHTFTMTQRNFALTYVDVILCTKQ